MLEITLHNAIQHDQRPLGAHLVLGADGLPLQGEGAGVRLVLENVSHNEATLSVTNCGQSIVLPGGLRILPGMARELELPTEFCVGRTTVYVQPSSLPQPYDDALTPFPRMENDPRRFAMLMKKLGGAPSSHTLAYWFNALGRLQQSPAGSHEFFRTASQVLFDPGGLDVGMVLARNGDEWRIEASYVCQPHAAMTFRRDILERMVAERHTLFHDARTIDPALESRGGGFVVASPVIDPDGEITGAVYGVRFDHASNNRRGIRPLEAQFVQAVADAVSAGQMRLSRESDVVRLKSRLELAFSPTVARELERNPRLLEGDQREVTILFCDLRGFTSLCERLTPRQSYALLSDVMDRFTHDVMRHDGVLIDYFGDGLAAFWNAPLEQPDHAVLACQSARAMIAGLAEVSDDWYPVTGRHLRLGVGIHTGTALVGNVGSRSRIKYGPRGSAVNLASRVQGATKPLGVTMLVTQSTARLLPTEFKTHSLGRQPLEGFAEPVELFELDSDDSAAKAGAVEATRHCHPH